MIRRPESCAELVSVLFQGPFFLLFIFCFYKKFIFDDLRKYTTLRMFILKKGERCERTLLFVLPLVL